MKRILPLILLVLLSSNVWAKTAAVKTLKIGGVNITDYVISSNATVTSDSLSQTGNVGFMSLLTKVSGSVTLSYQVSNDNSNWYTPYTTDGTTLTAAGTIASAVTADRWIILPARLSPWIRFIFASSGASTITSQATWQNDN